MIQKAQDAIGLVRKKLEKEKRQIDERIQNLTLEDPFLQEDRRYTHEPAQDATDTAGHDRILALKAELLKHKENVKKALAKIGIGTYGKCELCKREIGQERLAIMPMATLCLVCEQKQERNSPR